MRSFWRREPSKATQSTIVIAGAGEVGFHIAKRLASENKQVVVVDQNPAALRRLADTLDVQTIEGSASSPKILDVAGVEDADIFLAVTDSDEINIIACFFANILNPDAVKLARIRNDEYSLYRDALTGETLNISMLINPEVEIIKTIERMVTVPGALEYSEFVGGKVKLIGLRLKEPRYAGLSLIKLREEMGDVSLIIGAILRNERLIIPTGRDTVEQGDLLYVVTEDRDIPEICRAFGCEHLAIRDVLIIGGGNIGLKLATLFERKGYHVKLVDKDEDRCQWLAGVLNKTIVLKGDGTDQDFLLEENVAAMDLVVSLTGDEETNILSSLLSKNMGAKKTITRVNKTAYLPLVRAIGIEHSVSPRLSAVNSILHYVRKGSVLSTVSIKGEEAEALEAIALEKSGVVNKPLKEIDFPKGAIVLCLVRGDRVIVPTGDTVILPEDRIIILALRHAVSKVEDALAVKLEYV
ncbi:Trk system potassium transporter TrkA [Oceanidesulfovibrio marinus]|uniref:Trk system potassium uptake protein TrkA n=1 Tax=Oceanidesulfovibrio marinus TaxID=370038 RepID=A0A6P1ZLZ6_9BACT|nr:Trk system potassium transporter TrkA [Oceanidesulfovibrio marinus]QJT08183.1 Trk system potassium transporter TrkA [Oceanidesulfovibrio marinus]TVM35078.1 Trk system potassium transporter TrkA [Oceanidesulfovibrio marinus]